MNRDTDRLLIVDDERAEREALEQYLTKAGFVVEAAESGEEALEKLAEYSFGLLITDLRLPGMDGLDVIRRAHELQEEIAVLLITAFASVDSAVEALRLGAEDYLLKPLILEEVERKARSLLARAPKTPPRECASAPCSAGDQRCGGSGDGLAGDEERAEVGESSRGGQSDRTPDG